MNSSQFKRALTLAESGDVTYLRWDGERPIIDLEIFEGCGLPGFKPVLCTISQVAAMVLYQAMQLSGEWDTRELASCKEIARTKFQIINDPIADLKVLKAEARARRELDAADIRRIEEARRQEMINRPVRRRLTQVTEV